MRTDNDDLNYIFRPPIDMDSKVWRYMDFAKFVNFLSTRALYFARYDKFEDKLEGHIPQKNKDAIIGDNATENYNRVFESIEDWQLCHFFNCWQLRDYESATMWKNYTDARFGVAVQTTYRALLNEFKDRADIKIGIVDYLDKQESAIRNQCGEASSLHLYYPFFTKDLVYSDESELRIMYSKIEESDLIETGKFFSTTIEHGTLVEIRPENIVKNIIVSPFSQAFFIDTVKDAIKNFGYQFSVVDSSVMVRR